MICHPDPSPPTVKEGVAESGARPVAVIDGAKAGIEVLAGLSRTKYRQLGL